MQVVYGYGTAGSNTEATRLPGVSYNTFPHEKKDSSTHEVDASNCSVRLIDACYHRRG